MTALELPPRLSLSDRLEALNKTYAVVRWNSQTLIMCETFSKGERRKLSFMTKDGFILWNDNQIAWEKTSNGETKKVKVGRAWLEWEGRRQYEELIFEPKAEPMPGVYNLWTGFSFTEKQDAGKFDIFLDHLRTNICKENEEHYQGLLAWIADLFQRPDRKLGTSLVLRGKMGVGKGVVAKHIGALVKKHYFAVNRAAHVTGRFNGHLADTLLLFLDEAFWAGDKEAEGTLKALVTEAEVPIELKGKDLYRIKSYLRLIISTNNDWAVPTGMKDERRFAIFDVAENCRDDKAYFAAMENQLKAGGYEAMLYFFLHHEYDPLLAAKIPTTDALLDQKFHTLTPELKWWYNCLSNSHIGEYEVFGHSIKKTDFYAAYINFCKQMNIRHPADQQWLARKLQEKCLFRQKPDLQDISGWKYQILSLQECRDSFVAMIGQKIDWEE